MSIDGKGKIFAFAASKPPTRCILLSVIRTEQVMLVFHGYEGAIVFWGGIVLIVFFTNYFGYRSRASRHRLIETMLEKGHPVPPELLTNSGDYGRIRSPVQSGIFLMCIGVALAVFLWAMGTDGFGGDHDVPSWLPVVGIFPFMVGLARLLGWVSERKALPK